MDWAAAEGQVSKIGKGASQTVVSVKKPGQAMKRKAEGEAGQNHDPKEKKQTRRGKKAKR